MLAHDRSRPEVCACPPVAGLRCVCGDCALLGYSEWCMFVRVQVASEQMNLSAMPIVYN